MTAAKQPTTRKTAKKSATKRKPATKLSTTRKPTAKRAAKPTTSRTPAPRTAAPGAAGHAAAFAALCAILRRQSKGWLVPQEGPRGMQVFTKQEFGGKPFWLAGVRWGKSYISFLIISVYMFPDLLKNISPQLRKRMQGKSCFNFRDADPVLIRELDALTRVGFARVKRDGPAMLAKYGKA